MFNGRPILYSASVKELMMTWSLVSVHKCKHHRRNVPWLLKSRWPWFLSVGAAVELFSHYSFRLGSLQQGVCWKWGTQLQHERMKMCWSKESLAWCQLASPCETNVKWNLISAASCICSIEPLVQRLKNNVHWLTLLPAFSLIAQ